MEDEFGQLIHADTGEVFKQEDEVAPEIALGGGQHGWHDALLSQGTPELATPMSSPILNRILSKPLIRWKILSLGTASRTTASKLISTVSCAGTTPCMLMRLYAASSPGTTKCMARSRALSKRKKRMRTSSWVYWTISLAQNQTTLWRKR